MALTPPAGQMFPIDLWPSHIFSAQLVLFGVTEHLFNARILTPLSVSKIAIIIDGN